MEYAVSLLFLCLLFICLMRVRKKNNKSIPRYNSASLIKTNCDGCWKQPTCQYGYIIYDDIENFRLTLSDKFIFSGGLDCFDESCFDENSVATIEELHNMNALKNMDIDKLINTFNYIQARKVAYCNFGKCGRMYFNEMGYNDEKKWLKEAIDSIKNKEKGQK